MTRSGGNGGGGGLESAGPIPLRAHGDSGPTQEHQEPRMPIIVDANYEPVGQDDPGIFTSSSERSDLETARTAYDELEGLLYRIGDAWIILEMEEGGVSRDSEIEAVDRELYKRVGERCLTIRQLLNSTAPLEEDHARELIGEIRRYIAELDPIERKYAALTTVETLNASPSFSESSDREGATANSERPLSEATSLTLIPPVSRSAEPADSALAGGGEGEGREDYSAGPGRPSSSDDRERSGGRRSHRQTPDTEPRPPSTARRAANFAAAAYHRGVEGRIERRRQLSEYVKAARTPESETEAFAQLRALQRKDGTREWSDEELRNLENAVRKIGQVKKAPWYRPLMPTEGALSSVERNAWKRARRHFNQIERVEDIIKAAEAQLLPEEKIALEEKLADGSINRSTYYAYLEMRADVGWTYPMTYKEMLIWIEVWGGMKEALKAIPKVRKANKATRATVKEVSRRTPTKLTESPASLAERADAQPLSALDAIDERTLQIEMARSGGRITQEDIDAFIAICSRTDHKGVPDPAQPEEIALFEKLGPVIARIRMRQEAVRAK